MAITGGIASQDMGERTTMRMFSFGVQPIVELGAYLHGTVYFSFDLVLIIFHSLTMESFCGIVPPERLTEMGVRAVLMRMCWG